jgi:hypothetical protein
LPQLWEPPDCRCRFAGGVSAAAPTADIQTQISEVSQEITFHEEEISDVGLGTFSTFDKERVETYDVD